MAKKVVVVHCSPRAKGNSSMLADEFIRGAEEAGNQVTRMDVGRASIHGCMACEYCFSHEGACVQDDDMQQLYPALREADVLVYATPMYFYNLPAQLHHRRCRRGHVPPMCELLQAQDPGRGDRERRVREGRHRGESRAPRGLSAGAEHPLMRSGKRTP